MRRPWSWRELSQASPEEIRSVQNAHFSDFMLHQAPYSPYYRELFRENGWRFQDFQTVDDLVRLPFTTKEDLAPTPEDPGKSRRFILQPDEKLIRHVASKKQLMRMAVQKMTGGDVRARLEWEYKPIHTHFTTGRSAAATPFVYSARDIAVLQETGRRLFDVSGALKDSLAINGFPYAPHLAFWLAYHALMASGMTSLQTGGGKAMGTEKIIQAIERTKAQVLIFIPGYAIHLLREAVAQGRNFSSVTHIIFGGERLSSGVREKAHELLTALGARDVKILTTYAFTEAKTAWIQCAEQTGYHLYPDVEFVELVDDKGNRVRENQPGEVVYTSLNWRGSAVIRYRTGDMAQGMSYSPCPSCGRTVARIHPDIQRKSEVREFQLTKVKGQLVNLNEFYPLMSKEAVEEWQVEIRKKNNDPFELDEIVIYIAVKSGGSAQDVMKRIEHVVRTEMDITPVVIVKNLSEILERLGMETELKERRIIDTRPK